MVTDIIARAMAKKANALASSNEGHINTFLNEEIIHEYIDTILPDTKYSYIANSDFSLSLPEISNTNLDHQFVLYLTCENDIDLTLPEGVYITGNINTNAGVHKIIGTWLPEQQTWGIGCIDYEEAE